ncbi:glucans biosynthesis glucosyltransferase MdoH [Roseobacteraceae bacterium S113]
MAVSVDRLMQEYARAIMPTRAALPMAPQDFARRPAPHAAPREAVPAAGLRGTALRLAAFAPTFLVTALLCYAIALWCLKGGLTWVEGALIGLVGLTFVWVSFSVSTVLMGLAYRATRPCRALYGRGAGAAAQDVALLMPIYGEVPWDVFGNAAAMLSELAQGARTGQAQDRYSLFILSDTQDAEIAALEELAFYDLRARCPEGLSVYYRRRAENRDKKVGNLSDWIENWGGAYDAMLVLDADSLMSGAAIRRLSRALAEDPGAGLIQSFPQLVGAETLFGRMQQFSNAVYGWLLAEGLALWSQREGNYWGHNAIIRTRAFAAAARLPYLGARETLILSHDFVEASMLRRAGWSVRFLPFAEGSYEETPQTLIDYALRDRRWCRGNLQHLRLLASRGFHSVSRFHLLQGAVAFLMSPAWFLMTLLWAFAGVMPGEELRYFSQANPLYPIWPEGAQGSGLWFLGFICAMLILPKVLGASAIATRSDVRARYGGIVPFAGTTLVEIALAILYAPILMVQQTQAVFLAMLGRSGTWAPQARGTTGYSMGACLRFHWMESVIGVICLGGMMTGSVSLWLLPIGFSLAFAAPLSWISAMRVGTMRLSWLRLESPHMLGRAPRIFSRARAERARFKQVLTTPEPTPQAMAAE